MRTSRDETPILLAEYRALSSPKLGPEGESRGAVTPDGGLERRIESSRCLLDFRLASDVLPSRQPRVTTQGGYRKGPPLGARHQRDAIADLEDLRARRAAPGPWRALSGRHSWLLAGSSRANSPLLRAGEPDKLLLFEGPTDAGHSTTFAHCPLSPPSLAPVSDEGVSAPGSCSRDTSPRYALLVQPWHGSLNPLSTELPSARQFGQYGGLRAYAMPWPPLPPRSRDDEEFTFAILRANDPPTNDELLPIEALAITEFYARSIGLLRPRFAEGPRGACTYLGLRPMWDGDSLRRVSYDGGSSPCSAMPFGMDFREQPREGMVAFGWI
ncbi:hypothetical protein KM043_010235 [Ampulex compressa]|nr:hypothetical protein KM043_010235 [Ampulex compressa]